MILVIRHPQAQLLNNPESQLNQRIDLILTLGPVVAQNIALFGATQASKTPGGLWPSDHARVSSRLVVTFHGTTTSDTRGGRRTFGASTPDVHNTLVSV